MFTHWLPIAQRIDYKFSFNSLSLANGTVQEQLNIYTHSGQLRSAFDTLRVFSLKLLEKLISRCSLLSYTQLNIIIIIIIIISVVVVGGVIILFMSSIIIPNSITRFHSCRILYGPY